MDYLDLRAYKDPVYVEAIKDGEIIRIPESIAIGEDLFILRRLGAPPQQLQSLPVSQSASKRESSQKNPSLISEWKLGKFGVKKNNVLQDLVPNFHWQISSNRKRLNLSRQRLAQMIGANEHDVKLLELGELPSDDFILISRIEQAFGINLRKYAQSAASVSLADLQKNKEQSDKKKKNIQSHQVTDSNSDIAGTDIEIIED